MKTSSINRNPKPKKLSTDSIITFGKYKNQPMFSIIEEDPSYIRWAIKNVEWFRLDKEAMDLLKTWEQPKQTNRSGEVRDSDNVYRIPAAFADKFIERFFHNPEVDGLQNEPFCSPEDVFGPNGSDNGWGHGL